MQTTRAFALSAALATAGVALQAQESGPSEHIGLDVQLLGALENDALEKTVGLAGYTLRMRGIEIAAGGQIAEHSHAERPGLVTVVAGDWTEGRPDGETVYSGDDLGTFVEEEDTVHWVYNRTDAPATAVVCDIVATQ